MILAFNLYCKILFGKMHSKNPEIINLAGLIDRSPNAVALKLCNFASFDPILRQRGIKGMTNVGKKDEEVWNEFINDWDSLIFESEKLLSNLQNHDIIKSKEKEIPQIQMTGKDQLRLVKTRINQNFFRQSILSNYSYKCAICSLDMPELLIAGHIIPWSLNSKERLNPQNGICFCSLHDKAFDTGLIGISGSFQVLLSERIAKKRNEEYFGNYFGKYENKQICLPEKFFPNASFLQIHRELHDLTTKDHL